MLSGFGSRSDRILETLLVVDDEIRSLKSDKIALLEFLKQTRHRLARGPDHLRDFLVRVRNFQVRAFMAVAP